MIPITYCSPGPLLGSLVHPPSWTQSEAAERLFVAVLFNFGIQLTDKPTYTRCWSQLTNAPLHTTKWKLHIQQQPSTGPTTVNGLIKFASSTQLEGSNDDSLLEPLWVFFPIHLSLAHFWRLLPVPLCLNYLAMPSWDAIIQTLIPFNFHTCVCTLTCLMFTITYIGASSLSLRIRDTGAHTVGWRKEGFYPLSACHCWGEAVHFHINMRLRDKKGLVLLDCIKLSGVPNTLVTQCMFSYNG